MLSQQLDTMVTRDHFDLHVEQIDQRFSHVYQRFDQIDRRFDQLSLRFEQTDQSIAGLDTRIGLMERRQSAHTVLLSIITLAVLIPLIQVTVAGSGSNRLRGRLLVI